MVKYMSNKCRKGEHKHCSRFVGGNPPRPCKCKCHKDTPRVESEVKKNG